MESSAHSFVVVSNGFTSSTFFVALICCKLHRWSCHTTFPCSLTVILPSTTVTEAGGPCQGFLGGNCKTGNALV